jgi:DNA-binding Lrp family transcriptional regulator
MDDTDRALISLLRRDARLSVADLAHKLKVSRGTVSNRLRKLDDDGVMVEGNQPREVLAHLLGEPGVDALHDTNGRWDPLAELQADTMAELSQVLERNRLIKGIRTTETSILLAAYH